MKPQLTLILTAIVAAGALSSCCELPPLPGCPCQQGGYRPFGQPASPTEAYRAGYVAGQNDRQEKRASKWSRHSDMVPIRYHSYAERGYADGFAGRITCDLNAPQRAGNPMSKRFTTR